MADSSRSSCDARPRERAQEVVPVDHVVVALLVPTPAVFGRDVFVALVHHHSIIFRRASSQRAGCPLMHGLHFPQLHDASSFGSGGSFGPFSSRGEWFLSQAILSSAPQECISIGSLLPHVGHDFGGIYSTQRRSTSPQETHGYPGPSLQSWHPIQHRKRSSHARFFFI